MLTALLLAGGYGTRLRPLTLDYPKPLLPFANEPTLFHQLKALAKVGVKRSIIAVAAPSTPLQPSQKAAISPSLEKWSKELDMEILVEVETQPLGTAGAIRLSKENLLKDNEEGLYFVLNGDVACSYPFAELLEQHRKNSSDGRKARGTILVTPVEDPSRYGVVLTAGEGVDGRITQFVEKPKERIPNGNHINAGLYLLHAEAFDFMKQPVGDDPMPPKCSIEKEVFPKMAEEEKLYSMELKGYWADIGKPLDYILALKLHLRAQPPADLTQPPSGGEYTLEAPCLIDPSVKIGKGCVIGPDVSIGPNSVIEDGAKVQGAAVLDGTTIKANAVVSGSVVSSCNTIGEGASVTDGCILAQGINVLPKVAIKGVSALPCIDIKEDCEGKILMC